MAPLKPFRDGFDLLGGFKLNSLFMRNGPGVNKGNWSNRVSNHIIPTKDFFLEACYGIGKENGLSSEVLGDF